MLFRSIQNESRLRERYAELDRLADITQRYIDELETDRTTRGLSPEGEQRLQQLRNNLEEYINEQIAIDAELNPPQDWEPDPTHPANAPIDDLQLFQDLRQPEPRTYEQLLADANSIVDTINRINERIAAATTPEQHTELINARSVYHNTLREINGQMEALQQQQMQQNPRAQAHLDELDAEYAQVVTRLDQLNQADREGIMPVDHALLNDLREQAGILRRAREELRNQIFGPQQLPAPPAEVRLQPEQVPVTLLNNDALAARMTNDMLADATPMVEHLREQIQEFRRDGEGPDAIRGFLEEVRDNAELYFGEADPYVVEYAIRVAEGSWRPGFAKGGHVRIAKTIPAMRAELRRT